MAKAPRKSTAPEQAALLEKDPTDKHEAFAAYVQEQTGHTDFTAREAQLAYVLMSKFQKSDQNQRLLAEAKANREKAQAARAARAAEKAQKTETPAPAKSSTKAAAKSGTKTAGTSKTTGPRSRKAAAAKSGNEAAF